jgi:predicted amidophosphoribosyltransferase
MIYTLKGCYDIELAEVFLNRFLLELKIMYFGYVIVPLPSNLDEDERRGFNHVEQVFSYLKLPIYHLLYKKIHFKQSDLSLHQREEIINKIGYEHLELIKGKKVLIVDDISTSGNSLKAAIALIKKGNPKCVKVLVLAKKCRK